MLTSEQGHGCQWVRPAEVSGLAEPRDPGRHPTKGAGPAPDLSPTSLRLRVPRPALCSSRLSSRQRDAALPWEPEVPPCPREEGDHACLGMDFFLTSEFLHTSLLCFHIAGTSFDIPFILPWPTTPNPLEPHPRIFQKTSRCQAA